MSDVRFSARPDMAEDVLSARDGRLGRILLNRPKVINAAIDSYPKPFVAFMDGIVMGGGVGVSAHGSLRLVTERSRVAMPETDIGFFPDVGSLFLLSR